MSEQRKLVGRIQSQGGASEPTGRASRVLQPVQVGPLAHGHVLKANGKGSGEIPGYALPCGALIAVDGEGCIMFVGAPPQPEPVACAHTVHDNLREALKRASRSYEQMSGEHHRNKGALAICERLLRAIVRLLKSLPDSVVDGIPPRVLAEVLSEDAELARYRR